MKWGVGLAVGNKRSIAAIARPDSELVTLERESVLHHAPDGTADTAAAPWPIPPAPSNEPGSDDAEDLPTSDPDGTPVAVHAPTAEQVVAACERRAYELIMPWKAKILFVLSQVSPRLGDWIIGRSTR